MTHPPGPPSHPALRGQVALVTGASRGLGVVIAEALARQGADLALVARSAEPLLQLAGLLRALGVRAEPIVADISLPDDRERMVREATAKLGAIDILINNAGVEHGAPFVTQPLEQMREILRVNVEGTLEFTRLTLPGMLARRHGVVVTVASLAGKMGLPYASVYGGSKAALIAWSRALNVELDGTGVRAVTVTPGYVSGTGMFSRFNVRAPGFLGESQPSDVAAGVLRAINGRAGEVFVNPKPVWPMLLLHALAPEPMMALLKKRGVFEWMKQARAGGDQGEGR